MQSFFNTFSFHKFLVSFYAFLVSTCFSFVCVSCLYVFLVSMCAFVSRLYVFLVCFSCLYVFLVCICFLSVCVSHLYVFHVFEFFSCGYVFVKSACVLHLNVCVCVCLCLWKETSDRSTNRNNAFYAINSFMCNPAYLLRTLGNLGLDVDYYFFFLCRLFSV